MDVLPQFILNGIIAGSIYALLAVSFNFIYSVTKFFNLAHGSIAVIGAYTVFFFGKELGWPSWIAILLGILFAAFSGLLIDRVIYYPLRKKNASSMVLLVASLGVLIIIQACLAIIFSSKFQTISSTITTYRLELFGANFTSLHLTIFCLGIIISSLLFLLFKKTTFGKAVNAVSDDEEVAKIVGINTDRIMASVFLIGSAIAGLAGILAAFDTGIQPTSDLHFLLKAVVAAIIGGVGNIYAALLGAFLLGLAENIGILFIPAEWKEAIAFGILIIFLIWRPNGILRR